MQVLNDDRFAALFAPGSRAEVPIVGSVTIAGETVAVSGQVDRLVVTPDAVLIADFKTGRETRRTDSRAMPNSSRSTARCCKKSIQAEPCAPRSSGPKYLI